jgi:hypothetical protein
MLPREVKEKVEAAMAMIYECGENRDDVIDNLNAQVASLIDETNESDYLEYRFDLEARYERDNMSQSKTVYVLKAHPSVTVYDSLELAMKAIEAMLEAGVKYGEFELITCPMYFENI